MNKELEVLYKIFELELAPPFELSESHFKGNYYEINNKYSNLIGWFHPKENAFEVHSHYCHNLSLKIKQVFNIERLVYDDVFYITKHLINWLQNNFEEKIEVIEMWNSDTATTFRQFFDRG